MDSKKSVAVSVCALLLICLFAVVGSCFMAYLYEDEKVVIKSPRIVAGAGISVTNSKGEPIDKLEFSDLKLGLKPVTGELDSETKVPVTVHDKNGSEGIFAKFSVKSSRVTKLSVQNLRIEGNDSLDFAQERKNIWLSVMEVKNSTNNFEDEKVELCELTASTEGATFTLLLWFASVSSENFESSTISFDIVLE